MVIEPLIPSAAPRPSTRPVTIGNAVIGGGRLQVIAAFGAPTYGHAY